ncbi:hypothetical protein F2Q70_00000536 [Brassica cretica]|uniref:Nucleoside-diphosphate kinase n=1 Tax=Brassica cretica TaxID=69181 RepID=A0A8S9IP79_BRACR|nr:hypothetical protein F2Q70_00000536 [Brassica cretica]
MIGKTDPLQAEPGTIRGDLAVQTGRNIVHGSDSPENGKREIGKPRTSRFIFKAFNVVLEDIPPSARRNASTNLTTLHQGPPTSAYVHLPFYRKRCHYCDFPILALGTSSTSPTLLEEDDPRITNYVNLLVREINATRTGFDANPNLKTVFFGGGTPSLVPPKLVSLVLETLSSSFGLYPGEKLKELMGLGVNRVSLGVQAFQDELLRACGVSEVYEADRDC